MTRRPESIAGLAADSEVDRSRRRSLALLPRRESVPGTTPRSARRPSPNETLKIWKMIGIVRAGCSISEAEDITFHTTLRLGRVLHGDHERGIGVAEFPHHLVVAPLSAQGEEMWVVVVGLDRLDLTVGHPGPDPSCGYALPAGEVRQQIANPHPIGVSDCIEPLRQLIGAAGQLSTSLTHACQEGVAS